MAKKIKISKIAAVACLTVLVWVWADLAKMEQYTVSGAKLTVARNADSSLWASFDDEPLVSIEKIVLKGSASRVADARREMENGTLDFDFSLDPEQEESLAKQGEYLWDVQAFLKRSSRIRQRGLTVVSCEPNQVDVRVVKLIKQSLTVTCVDKDGNPIKTKLYRRYTCIAFQVFLRRQLNFYTSRGLADLLGSKFYIRFFVYC